MKAVVKNIKIQTKLWMIMFALLLLESSAIQAYAAVSGRLLQIVTDGEDMVAYVECDSRIESVQAQIAQYSCENVEVISPKDISIHTVIMVDNSLSITEKNRENIKSILRQYVQGLPEKEVISLALFGEEMQYLAEKSNNKEELIRLIDEVEFHDQDTYLTDYLFQAVEEIENDSVYTRFIVISDGVDNKAIGITKEELTDKLKEVVRPIYAIGHVYGENESQLKNMFALSRITNGKELLIEDFEDIALIVNEIHDFSNIYSLKMKIPQSVMDGGNRHALLNLHTEEGDLEIKGEALMPFGSAQEAKSEIEPTPVPTPVPTPEPTIEPTPQPVPEPEKDESIGTGQLAGVLLLVLAIAFLILYQKRKKTDTKKEKKDKKPVVPAKAPVQKVIPENIQAEDETVILDGRYLLILRDRLNPERIFRYPLDGHVIVGRNTDRVQIAIDDSRTISGQHCEFYVRGNRFFIRDLNSSNHTYLDNKMINAETEVVSGNIVRFGEAEFCIEIMPI